MGRSRRGELAGPREDFCNGRTWKALDNQPTKTMIGTNSYGVKFIFGVPVEEKRPRLPDGFLYVLDPKTFLMATNGREHYYVMEDKLVRAHPKMKLVHEGGWYCDTDETIPLECTPPK